ncbi:type II toxin-antitoxin system VapC family toxin [Pseudanabaena yagii]|uniref:PIN domain-containing protein n=1 Tax=Pseudanabaena yagii GIHE-NHR1 TaxID=2722753 RepID=A0ABX1LNZ4_9CYAN|nr:PIN domain-containing protein [Pseudanabaena yagii]NMF57845.1 PIN domain-containing protein [Pseudanabaena yagii GIHE-NHR1]
MIIIDTGAFVALFNRRDSAHLAAQRAFETIQEPMITTFPVITETCYFLAATASHTAQSNFLKSFVLGAFQIFDLEPNHIDRMIVLMEKYADLPMDMADASLVVLAEQFSGRILTVDRRDFSVYRWNNKPFENLLI